MKDLIGLSVLIGVRDGLLEVDELDEDVWYLVKVNSEVTVFSEVTLELSL